MTSPLLDLGFALDFLEGDEDLCVQLLHTFLPALEDAEASLPGLIADGQWSEVGAIVHKLVPSLRIFCPAAVQPLAELSEMSRQADGHDLAARAPQALLFLRGLASEVRQYLASSQPQA